MEIKIVCAYTKLVPLSELSKLRNPRNTNDHPPEQIDELVEQFKFQGVRHPIIISKRDGLFAAGDGRFQAAEKLGMTEFPVDYQDFETEEQQFAFGVADNETQKWSTTNLKLVHIELPKLQPFDIDRLAIRGFEFEPDPEEGATGADSGNSPTLSDRFLITPFSVFNAREGWWQDRKRAWISLGIKSELGRGDATPPGGGLNHSLGSVLESDPHGIQNTSNEQRATSNERKNECIQEPKQIKPNTLGAIAPNQNTILKRTGKYE